MNRPTRVLWLAKGLGRGGAEQLIRLSVPHLQRHGFHVEVAYTLPHKDAFVGELESDGVPVHSLGSSRTWDARWVVRLRRLVRSRGYDLIHTHSPVPALGARLLRPRGTVVVHTEHNVWDRYRRPTRLANIATFGRNAAVLAVSKGVEESIARPAWAPWVRMPQVETLHHGPDSALVRRGPDARAHAREVLGLAPTDLVLGTVANFTPKKDQRSLLAAFRSMVDDYPDLRLVLVGSGPLEEALRAQVDSDRLGNRVLFAGSRDDVQTILPAFDVFVLSSLHEGLPISLLEAMAAGLPCVATRVGGVPEAMQDGREGFLVPVRDPDALAAALRKLVTDPGLRESMGAVGVRRAEDFSIPAAVDRMASIYRAVLADAGGPG